MNAARPRTAAGLLLLLLGLAVAVMHTNPPIASHAPHPVAHGGHQPSMGRGEHVGKADAGPAGMDAVQCEDAHLCAGVVATSVAFAAAPLVALLPRLFDAASAVRAGVRAAARAPPHWLHPTLSTLCLLRI